MSRDQILRMSVPHQFQPEDEASSLSCHTRIHTDEGCPLEYADVFRTKSGEKLFRVSALGSALWWIANHHVAMFTVLAFGLCGQTPRHLLSLHVLGMVTALAMLGSGVISDSLVVKSGRRRPPLACFTIGGIIGLSCIVYGALYSTHGVQSSVVNIFLGIPTFHDNATTRILAYRCQIFNESDKTTLEEADIVPSILFGIILIWICISCADVILKAYILDLSMANDFVNSLAILSSIRGLSTFLWFCIVVVLIEGVRGEELIKLMLKILFSFEVLFLLGALSITFVTFKELPLSKMITAFEKFDNISSMIEKEKENEPIEINIDELNLNVDDESLHDSKAIELEFYEIYFRIKALMPQNLLCYLKSVFEIPRFMWNVILFNVLMTMTLDSYRIYLMNYILEFVTSNPILSDASKRYLPISKHSYIYFSWGMILNGLSVFSYSSLFCGLVAKFKMRTVLLYSLIFYPISSMALYLLPHEVSVLLISLCSGLLQVNRDVIVHSLLCSFYLNERFSKYRGLATDLSIVATSGLVGTLLLVNFVTVMSLWLDSILSSIFLSVIFSMLSIIVGSYQDFE